RISRPWNVCPGRSGRSSGGAVGSVAFWANPAMHLGQRSPEYMELQVEHFFIVFISPPCIKGPPSSGYTKRRIFPIVLSSYRLKSNIPATQECYTLGEGREEFLQLVVDLVLALHRPGHFLLEEVPVAAAGAVDDDLHVGLAQPEPLGHFLQGAGLTGRDVLAE